MISPINIDHIYLLVSDLERSKRYYERLFNIVCRPHPNDNLTLIVESPFVHFFIKKINGDLNLESNQHISFRVSELDHVIEELEKNKISYKTGIFKHFTYRKYKWVEWEDPDRIRLECIEDII